MNFQTLSAGIYHSLAIKSTGELWAWGANSDGRLGDGSTTQRSAPVQVLPGTLFKAVAGGYMHTVAIKTDGTLWAWGNNDLGQVGDGSITSRLLPVPVQVPVGKLFKAVAVGFYHSVALATDGSLWAWGHNAYGQLGDGTISTRATPVPVGTGFVSVAAGHYHSLGIKTDGSLWTWGYNGTSQLGDGTTTNHLYPSQLMTLGTGFTTVEAGNRFSVATKTDGSVWAWGDNASGQLGNGTLFGRTTPAQSLGGIAALYGLSVTPSGPGFLSSDPAGINCGTDCSENFYFGAQVSLSALPAAGYQLAAWSGACTGNGACVVTMDDIKNVTATFSAIPPQTLIVIKAGSGTGTVSSAPAGIDCGTDCTQAYPWNTAVTLTATPAAKSRFDGWSGACTGKLACVVTMDAVKNVTATFKKKPNITPILMLLLN